MASPRWIKLADMRGAMRLAVDATLGVTDLVESVHRGIAQTTLGATPSLARRADVLTGLVYRSVRGVTRLVGDSVGFAGSVLESVLGNDAESSPARDAMLAALNGVIGDHLDASGNPMALTMQWRVDGRALALDAQAIAAAHVTPRRRLFVLVHGLCLDDRSWLHGGHDYGQALARDCDGSAVYLRYNTGRAISRNGAELAASLEALADAWPVALDDIHVIAHSMGGLVVRSALHHAQATGMRWPRHVRSVAFLGTPHHGAPLEQGGHVIDRLLQSHPLIAPFARIGQLRSRGITDLRHGRVLDDAEHAAVPLPADIACHAIAATLRSRDGAIGDAMLGDGLVPVDSALGRGGERDLRLPAAHRHVVRGVGHLGLLGDQRVYARLRVIADAHGGPAR